jgi:hypothetical protein
MGGQEVGARKRGRRGLSPQRQGRQGGRVPRRLPGAHRGRPQAPLRLGQDQDRGTGRPARGQSGQGRELGVRRPQLDAQEAPGPLAIGLGRGHGAAGKFREVRTDHPAARNTGLGRVEAEERHPARIRGLYREKLDAGLSGRTVQYVHATLHKALKQAAADGLCRATRRRPSRRRGPGRRRHVPSPPNRRVPCWTRRAQTASEPCTPSPCIAGSGGRASGPEVGGRGPAVRRAAGAPDALRREGRAYLQPAEDGEGPSRSRTGPRARSRLTCGAGSRRRRCWETTTILPAHNVCCRLGCQSRTKSVMRRSARVCSVRSPFISRSCSIPRPFFPVCYVQGVENVLLGQVHEARCGLIDIGNPRVFLGQLPLHQVSRCVLAAEDGLLAGGFFEAKASLAHP